MNEESSFEAIILRTYPSRDSDLVLVVLSPTHGKRSLLAKRTRSSSNKKGVRFDVFDRGVFHPKIGRGSLPLVGLYEATKGFPKIRDNLTRIVTASTLCETCDHLVPEDTIDTDEIFETTALALQAFEECSTTKELLRALSIALAQILQASGYANESLLSQPPSSHQLFRLLAQVEEISERKLQCRSMVIELVESLGR
jgi:DNA repair protein RecO